MALEDLTGSNKFISNLVAGNPLSNDDRREGDDHIRGIKNVLRNSFPGVNAAIDFNNYVATAGGTMTGPLKLNFQTPYIEWNNPSAPANKRQMSVFIDANGSSGLNMNDGAVPANVYASLKYDQPASCWIATPVFKTVGMLQANAAGSSFTAIHLSGHGAGSKQGIASFPAADPSFVLMCCNAASSQVGNITSTATATQFNTTSDYRLKQDVQDMPSMLAAMMALRPVLFKWKSTGEADEGFIAHELAETVPHAVSGAKDAVDADGKPVYQGTDLSFIVPRLVKAVQELATRVTALEAGRAT